MWQITVILIKSLLYSVRSSSVLLFLNRAQGALRVRSIWLAPFYRWGNWGTDPQNDRPVAELRTEPRSPVSQSGASGPLWYTGCNTNVYWMTDLSIKIWSSKLPLHSFLHDGKPPPGLTSLFSLKPDLINAMHIFGKENEYSLWFSPEGWIVSSSFFLSAAFNTPRISSFPGRLRRSRYQPDPAFALHVKLPLEATGTFPKLEQSALWWIQVQPPVISKELESCCADGLKTSWAQKSSNQRKGKANRKSQWQIPLDNNAPTVH